jgi:DNA repair photolyase
MIYKKNYQVKTGEKMLVIYEPRGKAREYSRLAVNLYTGCGHRCEYCYAPAYVMTERDRFHNPVPRPNILEKLTLDSQKLNIKKQKGPVLLCFTCDPYQPIDEQLQLTRKAIQVLHSFGLHVNILTKGGRRAERDFDLLTCNDLFGVTLTNLDNSLSLKWEPFAPLPDERIETLLVAHKQGIKTWVSLEPVIYPEISMEIIKKTYKFVDEFKVGVLNYHPHASTVDWHKFARDVKNLLTELHCDFYLKEDLRKWL